LGSTRRQREKQTNARAKQQMFYNRLFNVGGKTYGLFRIAIHPPHDPDEALVDQLEMIKHLKEKESYEFMKYSDLLSLI
jgi:hypothetical protein